MTLSIKCSLFSWLRPASSFLLALVILTGSGAAQSHAISELEREWIRLVQALEPVDIEALRTHVDELLIVAQALDVERLTPMALSLELRARTLPKEERELLLAEARRLDPRSPEIEFSLAQTKVRRGSVPSAFVSLIRGVQLAWGDFRFTSAVRGSLLLASLLVVAGSFLAFSALALRHAIFRLWHDLTELGDHWRLERNSPVLALILLLLPVFLGFDFLWLALWLIALTWAYYPAAQKVFALAGLLFIAAFPLLTEFGFREMSKPFNPVLEAARALEEKRYHPQVQIELQGLMDLFGDQPEFHRLRGDLFRQAGLLDSAAGMYSDGLRLDPDNGDLSLTLGVVRLIQRDYPAAIQALHQGRSSGADPVFVNYNLSLAFAQTYQFRESDEALALARAQDEDRFRKVTRGREHLPFAPFYGLSDARSLLDQTDSVELLARGVLSPPLSPISLFRQPFTVGAVIALLLALTHFLLRERLTGFSVSCLKCGRAFCQLCKLSTESQSYCTQCINIFLKKDMVAIDAQVAKRRQLARRLLFLQIERRVADLVLPGLGLSFAGRPYLGVGLIILSGVLSTIGLVWAPFFAAPALIQDSPGPFLILFLIVWASLILTAQAIPLSRR